MAKLQHDAHEMFDLIDDATNNSDLAQGNVDAAAHFGMMIQGGITPEAMSDIQDDTVYGPDASPAYVAGYFHMWHTLYNEIYDALT